jgi:hypothetical protein
MRIQLRRAIPLLVIAVVLLPAPARADGFLSWLGKLSGPGPFIGANLDVCLETFPKREEGRVRGVVISCPDSRLEEQHFSWYATVGAGIALDNDLDYTGQDISGRSARVTYFKAGSSLMYTVHPSVDIGFGGGVMFFRGPRFSTFGMPYVQPVKVGVRPLLLRGAAAEQIKARGWLLLTADWTVLLGTIDGARFGAPADPLRVRNEFVPQFGFSIDVPRLLNAVERQRQGPK